MEILVCTRLIIAKDNQCRLACSNRMANFLINELLLWWPNNSKHLGED